MNMPLTAAPKNRAHPMLIVASVAVVLVSLTGTAAIMGWLPNSAGAPRTADPTASSVAGTVQQPAVYVAPQRIAAAPVVYRQVRDEPVRHAIVCQNCGTVDAVREVTSGGDSNGLGAAGGAVVGGLLGNQVGSGHGRDAMTVVGAIGGALAGNQIQKRSNATHSYQTTVHMNNGSTRTVAQANQPDWREGDHVKIVDGVVQMNG